MEKKGQSSTIMIVVAAAIALIVLVVLIAIFTGRLSLFERGLATCPYNCTGIDSATNTSCPTGYIKIGDQSGYSGCSHACCKST